MRRDRDREGRESRWNPKQTNEQITPKRKDLQREEALFDYHFIPINVNVYEVTEV